MPVLIKKLPSQETATKVERIAQARELSAANATKHTRIGEAKKRRSGHAKPRAPLISLDQPGRFYTGNVLAVANFSASSLFQRIKEGRWPAPHRDGHRNFWHTHEVKQALGL
jgi:hypothetical protein